MKRHIALGLALALAMASTSVEAQLGGLLKKRAREAIAGKKAEPSPAPAPTPDPAPTPGTRTPDPPPAAGGDHAAALSAEKENVSPLEVSELPMRHSATSVLRRSGDPRPNGDWNQLPAIPAAAVATAYALGASAQVALVETVGAALKAMVMSDTFMAEHEKSIKAEHQAVDHGLTGVVGFEEAMRKNDFEAIEAIQARGTVAMGVDHVRSMPANFLKAEFTNDLAKWKVEAANSKRRDQAKFRKLVAAAQPLEGLDATDEKFMRGFAVLKSIDSDGPDTEEAVFAIHQRVTQEREQIAYDAHNLKGRLKRELTAFVAIAAKVNFKAATVEKNGATVFVNPAEEEQGALWKACFRAGEGPTAAALKLARAWLAEL